MAQERLRTTQEITSEEKKPEEVKQEKIKERNNDDETLCCPILGQQLEHPVTTPCGHTFEKKAILKWIEEKTAETKKTTCDCPICRAPISANDCQVENVALKGVIELVKQLLEKKEELEEQLKAIELVQRHLSPKQKNIHPDTAQHIQQSEQTAQAIANLEYKQASLVLQRWGLSIITQKKLRYVGDEHTRIKNNKKDIMGRYAAVLSKIRLSLKKTAQLINPEESVELLAVGRDINNPSSAIQEQAVMLNQNLDAAKKAFWVLKVEYEKNVKNNLPGIQKNFHRWARLNKSINEEAKNLAVLRKEEERLSERSAERCRNTTATTLALFGGIKEIPKKLEVVEKKRDQGTIDSLLLAAVNQKNFNEVKILIDEGADINVEVDGQIPLLIAIRNENVEMLKFLLSYKGIKVDYVIEKDNKMNLLIHIIAKHGNSGFASSMVESLLEEKIDVNFQDQQGDTALHWAVYYSHWALVKILLSNGANPSIYNGEGKIAFDEIKPNDKVKLKRENPALLDTLKPAESKEGNRYRRK
jgi:ankyrin repeat protein